MTNDHHESRAGRTVSFRAPKHLVAAIEREAAKRLCSVSDVTRELVACDLRRRGLFEDA